MNVVGSLVAKLIATESGKRLAMDSGAGGTGGAGIRVRLLSGSWRQMWVRWSASAFCGHNQFCLVRYLSDHTFAVPRYHTAFDIPFLSDDAIFMRSSFRRVVQRLSDWSAVLFTISTPLLIVRYPWEFKGTVTES